MNSPHLLLAGKNPRQLKQNLVGILDQAALDKIEAEISYNCAALYELGMKHFRFASRQSGRQWRQVISRLYFAAYNISRTVRLGVNGEYSQEVGDHAKIGDLPQDFPNRSIYANRLKVLREDRNMSDYDHTAKHKDLIISRTDAIDLVKRFANDARGYLAARGIQV